MNTKLAAPVAWTRHILEPGAIVLCSMCVHFFGGAGPGHGKLVKPAHQKTLEKSLGIKDQSCPMLQLSDKGMWERT